MGTWVEDDPQQDKAPAPPRGPVQGIQHHKTPEKKQRERLSWCRNKVLKMDAEWAQGTFDWSKRSAYYGRVAEIEKLAPQVGL